MTPFTYKRLLALQGSVEVRARRLRKAKQLKYLRVRNIINKRQELTHEAYKKATSGYGIPPESLTPCPPLTFGPISLTVHQPQEVEYLTAPWRVVKDWCSSFKHAIMESWLESRLNRMLIVLGILSYLTGMASILL